MDAGLHQGEKRLQLRGHAEAEEEEKVQEVQAKGPGAGPGNVRSVGSREPGRILPRVSVMPPRRTSTVERDR